MQYLIDTQILLWFQEENKALPNHIRTIIEDPKNVIWVTTISFLEIAIKLKIGKLPDFVVSTNTIMQQAISDNFSIIQLESKHVAHYDALPLHDAHKDPFDRIIIATAMSENLPINYC